MYTLTLTGADRDAIDWVGYRYGHGNDLFKLLMGCEFDSDWDEPGDITFKIPEHVAWGILEIAEKCEYSWDCFSEDLSSKLTDFCSRIV